MDQATDADVIAASLVAGETFAEIFERHYSAVHRYACQRVGGSVADELASETFLVAFDRRASYAAGHPRALPWLLGITTNLMRRYWREERRQLEHASDAQVPVSPEQPLDGRLLGPHLVEALLSLRVEEREAVLLMAWADLTYEEIGHALDVPVGTVRSRVHRARARLRRGLSPREVSPETVEDPCHG